MKENQKTKILTKFDKDLQIKAKYFKKVFKLKMEEEDLCQELRLKVWKALDKWKKDIALKGYINTVCRNFLIDLLRKENREADYLNFNDF